MWMLNRKVKKTDYPAKADSFLRLGHYKNIGFSPKVIFDCGAFIGKWSKKIGQIYNESYIVAIEPNAELHEKLSSNMDSLKNSSIIYPCAVGAENGMEKLNIWKDTQHNNEITALAASSLLPHVQGEPSDIIEVNLKTIDTISQETGLKPDFIKLDLQGGEKDALLGAQEVLKTCELAMVEFGCLDAYVNRTTTNDLMTIFYDNDYCLYDIVDLLYRPFDGALSGGDFIFVKNSSKLREHKNYF